MHSAVRLAGMEMYSDDIRFELISIKKVGGRPPSVTALPEPGIEPGTFRSSV